MDLYCCQIDLKDDARALGFSQALDQWMAYLSERGAIGEWRLYRRKLGLASDIYRDFLLEIEVKDLAQLDDAFYSARSRSEEAERLYTQLHTMIEVGDFGLYRPFPDPERVERAALI